MRLSFKFAVLALALGAIAAPAAAVVTTFASFGPTGNTRYLRWVGSGSNATFYSTSNGTATTAGSRQVNFSFLQPTIAPYVTNVAATFTMNGTVTGTNATVSAGTITQTNVNGSFSFLSTAPIIIGSTTFAAGSNLLSGTFASAEISGSRNGSSAGFSASTPGSTISYTSDFLTFVGGSNFDFALSLTSINPLLNATNASGTTSGAPNKALRSFRAVIGGNFSSDPAPITPSIPEPESWIMMIAGFGLVGFSSRRRRTKVVAA